MKNWMHAEDAVEQIFDGATIALASNGGGLLEPDAVLAALEQRFLKTGHPRDLTVVHALGIGDGKGSGLGRFAHAGMVRRVIGGHWSWSPAMQKMAKDNAFEAIASPPEQSPPCCGRLGPDGRGSSRTSGCARLSTRVSTVARSMRALTKNSSN